MKFLYVCLLIVCLAACASSPNKKTSDNNVLASTKIKQVPILSSDKLPELTYKQQVYYFQHRVLPAWTFEYQEQFLNDLMTGNLVKLKSVAGDIVSQTFAAGISSRAISNSATEDETSTAAVIIFPEPKFSPNCYFVIVQNKNGNFSYTTYEKTSAILEDDSSVVGVVGAWDAEGTHLNFGPRSYEDVDSFIADVIK